MKNKVKIFLILGLGFISHTINAQNNSDFSASETREFVKNAIIYEVETMDPKMDYSKYVAANFMTHIDGGIFNYIQWVKHMQAMKVDMKSVQVFFKQVVVEKDVVAADYNVQFTKKNNEKREIQVLEFFWLKNGKIVYGDELTRLTVGQ